MRLLSRSMFGASCVALSVALDKTMGIQHDYPASAYWFTFALTAVVGLWAEFREKEAS